MMRWSMGVLGSVERGAVPLKAGSARDKARTRKWPDDIVERTFVRPHISENLCNIPIPQTASGM